MLPGPWVSEDVCEDCWRGVSVPHGHLSTRFARGPRALSGLPTAFAVTAWRCDLVGSLTVCIYPASPRQKSWGHLLSS